jgi:plastocyanin
VTGPVTLWRRRAPPSEEERESLGFRGRGGTGTTRAIETSKPLGPRADPSPGDTHMTTRPFLAPFAAALALGALPALAQHGGHDHAQHGESHKRAAKASAGQGVAEGQVENGVRVVEIAVTEDGFVPARIKANKGEKVRFVVTRKTNRTCGREIVMADHGVNQPLPLDKAVTVEFTPKKSGELRFACAMNHVTGVVLVP